MAETAGQGAPWTFFILALAIYGMDAFLRFGTAPWTHPYVWAIMALPYFLLWLDARKLPAFEGLKGNALVIFALLAYFWPLLSVLPHYAQWTWVKGVAVFLLSITPVWPAVTLLLGQFEKSFAMHLLSVLYIVILFVFSMYSFYPDIQEKMINAGFLPGSISPGEALKGGIQIVTDGIKKFYRVTFVEVPKKLGEEIERSIAMSRGDYYTGQVDAAAQKRLGVYLENFRAAEPYFYENTPVTAYVTMRAETLDKELPIKITCDANNNISADRILPQSEFSILTSDVYDIDCVWKKLGKGSHTLNLRTTFGFTTRAYIKTYIMDRDRLREYRRQNIDPLANVPDKQPVAIHTAGPVRIGMAVGQTQPLALGQRDEPLQPWGITIDNAWEGKVLEISTVYLYIPEGLKIMPVTEGTEVEKAITKTECAKLPEEEKLGCDESLVDVYVFSSEELSKNIYKNLTTKTFRVYTSVSDPDKVLGRAPIAVHNFKVSVQYSYLLERSLPIQVREVKV